MKTYLQIACIAILLSVSINLYAAKGDAKTKKGVVLKFSGFELKGFASQNLFSKTAFLMKGSFLLNYQNTEKAPQTTNVSTYMTVQRGNTTYIYPYKHKVSVSKFRTPVVPKL